MELSITISTRHSRPARTSRWHECGVQRWRCQGSRLFVCPRSYMALVVARRERVHGHVCGIISRHAVEPKVHSGGVPGGGQPKVQTSRAFRGGPAPARISTMSTSSSGTECPSAPAIMSGRSAGVFSGSRCTCGVPATQTARGHSVPTSTSIPRTRRSTSPA